MTHYIITWKHQGPFYLMFCQKRHENSITAVLSNPSTFPFTSIMRYFTKLGEETRATGNKHTNFRGNLWIKEFFLWWWRQVEWFRLPTSTTNHRRRRRAFHTTWNKRTINHYLNFLRCCWCLCVFLMSSLTFKLP